LDATTEPQDQDRHGLSGLFAFAQAHPRATAILVDELDAGGFESAADSKFVRCLADPCVTYFFSDFCRRAFEIERLGLPRFHQEIRFPLPQ
jgi:hypothetical protein